MYSSPLSLRDIYPQGGERLEMCICIKKEKIIYLCKMFIVILNLEYNVKLNIIHKFIIYFFYHYFFKSFKIKKQCLGYIVYYFNIISKMNCLCKIIGVTLSIKNVYS